MWELQRDGKCVCTVFRLNLSCVSFPVCHLQLTTVAMELDEYVKHHLSVYLMLGISMYVLSWGH